MSDLFLKLEIIKKIIVILSICVGFQFGVIGLVWGIVFTSFICLLVNTHYSSKVVNYKTKDQLLDMLLTLVLSIITFIVMYFKIFLFKENSNVIQLVCFSVGGILFYLIIHSFFNRSYLY